ncbi:MAG: hypothetical protein A3G81_08325 [Betaproteobacteria bacterium RIFCSPLOWO2_12_FULL_65_14]|nr:MAG: hypothetical protein A3G81_08325 [Betaproteobacteria bacterium RIFCSPLOWO2_12_FULL_65_14]
MGVEIRFTDREFPVSAVFIDFLYRHLNGHAFDTTWHDQLSEELAGGGPQARESANAHVAEVLAHRDGQRIIYRSYQLLSAFLTGAPEELRNFHERYKFICVVGVPRHGGSYLTKELFRALGIDYRTVPNVIAHDGFPDASPFDFAQGYNAYTNMMQNMAEYLAMVEEYFADSRLFRNRVVVPKKATKAAYHGAFFERALGPEAEYIVTLRHPVPACISTYEKSTGLPPSGRFAVRGNIEEWVRRDNVYTGVRENAVFDQDYFELFLRYWEHYHYNLVLTGLRRNASWTLATYGRERFEGLAQELHARFRSMQRPEAFQVFDSRSRHPEWMKKAEPVVLRVRDVWRTTGIEFPLDEVMEAW